jgi:hypothetical protein
VVQRAPRASNVRAAESLRWLPVPISLSVPPRRRGSVLAAAGPGGGVALPSAAPAGLTPPGASTTDRPLRLLRCQVGALAVSGLPGAPIATGTVP